MFTKRQNIHAHGLNRSQSFQQVRFWRWMKSGKISLAAIIAVKEILPEEMKDKGYSIPWYDIPIENAEIYKS